MKHLWLVVVLFVPSFSFAQKDTEYKSSSPDSIRVNPDMKESNIQPVDESKHDPDYFKHECDSPIPVRISGTPEYYFDPEMHEFGQYDPHFNPEPKYKAEKEIRIEHPDGSGDICSFVAYSCVDNSKSLPWTDDMLDLFDSKFEKDISPEQIKDLYCLRKENCNPRE
jgi:hypothetical protein